MPAVPFPAGKALDALNRDPRLAKRLAIQLRVNGLRVDQVTDGITPGNLSRYMDYTLVETTSDEVPEEALRIAEIFHADEEFLKLAKEGNK